MKFTVKNIKIEAGSEVLMYSDLENGGVYKDKVRNLKGSIGLDLFDMFLNDTPVVDSINYDIEKLPKEIQEDMRVLFDKIETQIEKDSQLTSNKLQRNNLEWEAKDRKDMVLTDKKVFK